MTDLILARLHPLVEVLEPHPDDWGPFRAVRQAAVTAVGAVALGVASLGGALNR